MNQRTILSGVVFLLLAGAAAGADGNLTIVKAGPVGEVASLAEANEVRVIFSEPMVAMGGTSQIASLPWFHIKPDVAGTFRWSGTTILIFTPDAKRPLQYATKYEVRIDSSATSIDGSQLAEPFRFQFTTPTLRLLNTQWQRKNGHYRDPLIVALRFNQPVDPRDVSRHIQLRFVPHPFDPPFLGENQRQAMQKSDPASLQAFEEKVASARKASEAAGPILISLADRWDEKRFPKGPDLLVLETRPGIPPGSWIEVVLDETIEAGRTRGPEVPGARQDFVMQLSAPFFVLGPYCASHCDPDWYNPIKFTTAVGSKDLRKSIEIANLADGSVLPRKERSESVSESFDASTDITLDELGYSLKPARSYSVKVAADLKSRDGQTLGYRWIGFIENRHQNAFTSFGDGHGVWETGGGSLLPFYSRNFLTVRQWARSLTVEELMPLAKRMDEEGFRFAPPGPGVELKLNPTPDAIQSHGLDLSKALGANRTGLVWAAVQERKTIPDSLTDSDIALKSTLVQVTNLGISVKDSALNTLIFVTRLDNGKPVEGANVQIRTLDNKVFWRGTTGRDGIAMASNTPLRDTYWKFEFIVVAEKDGDVAYVGSNWSEGIAPWNFGHSYEPESSRALLRGSVFTDRGVYRLGEEIHVKAVLRRDRPEGVELFPAGSEIEIKVTDAESREIDKRMIKLSAWSSAEWTFKLPPEGTLGPYQIAARIPIDEPLKPVPTEEEEYDDDSWRTVYGSFLVAAYRRPDFRVDVALASDEPIAGTKLNGKIAARYLFGAAMADRPVQWTFSRTRTYGVPASMRDRFTDDRYEFAGYDWTLREHPGKEVLEKKETKLSSSGELTLSLKTDAKDGLPHVYELEGNVTDVSRQAIANRTSTLVHPASFYVGIKRPPFFVSAKDGADTSVVALGLDGFLQSGIVVDVELIRIQWNSVRRAEGRGMYTWETERKEIPAGKQQVTTSTEPVPLHLDTREGGVYVIRASAKDSKGRLTTTSTSLYVIGEGYTAWERYDHNRIDLIPEKKSMRPGETARVMIKSPWETATALLTTEREGIRTYRQFELRSTQETVEIPITEKDIPNLFVSVLLIKGRTKASADDASDPGKPAFRLGYVELDVDDGSRRLTVEVKADKVEFRPASQARVDVSVRDRSGAPVEAEVTLWAVDYGVLSLTAYQTPDVASSVYIDKQLGVLNNDSRQRIVNRRVLTPKGSTEGGGGGRDPGAGGARKDFRVLAFWLGSVVTKSNGLASVQVKLPESLTTYRIMAVAADKESRFGRAETEIRLNKPVVLKPAFPRFLAVGDKVLFGSVITSQLKTAGTARLTMQSLDPAVLELTGPGTQEIKVKPGGSAEVRFDGIAKTLGTARIRTSVTLAGETDAYEDVIDVRILNSPEVTAAYGQVTDAPAREFVDIPSSVDRNVGGLSVSLASTALVGLHEGVRYLMEYPYGCAEQVASRALALALTADLGEAFSLPGLDPAAMKSLAQKSLTELEQFQCPNGGYQPWKGECWVTSPWLTSYIVHVNQRGKELGYSISPTSLENAYGYLEGQLSSEPPMNEGWWPSYTAWQAYTARSLVRGGRNQDSTVNRLYGYLDRMPVFAITYLHDSMVAKGEKGERITELRRRIQNAILPEGASAHVEELNDPYLLLFWNSNVRSTAIVLGSYIRAGAGNQNQLAPMARWLLAARVKGRWNNTQENAMALEALVDFYKKYESTAPDFSAAVTLNETPVLTSEFRGRSTESRGKELPMRELLPKAQGKTPLTFSKQGSGTLYYSARVKYVTTELFLERLDKGIHLERLYAVRKEGAVPSMTFQAGDLIEVTIRVRNSKERRWVAVTDPIPAGFEPVESWFATTASELARAADNANSQARDWESWFRQGGFDRVERHDDHVNAFATRLSEGIHEFRYLVRATTSGSFRTAPARAEEMYQPQVFGRTRTDVIEVSR